MTSRKGSSCSCVGKSNTSILTEEEMDDDLLSSGIDLDTTVCDKSFLDDDELDERLISITSPMTDRGNINNYHGRLAK